jgi:putative transposase
VGNYYKDYRHHDKPKVMTLDAGEFIRRFLLHVLPDGFRRIRHFGFLANAHRTARLATIRAVLDVPAPAAEAPASDDRTRYALLTGRPLDVCPCCGGRMVEVAILARRRPPWSPAWWDSS